jgi:hypothetical protein
LPLGDPVAVTANEGTEEGVGVLQIIRQVVKPQGNVTQFAVLVLAQILGHKLLPGAAALSVGLSYKDF